MPRAGLLAVSAGALLWGTTGVAVQIVHDRCGLSAVTDRLPPAGHRRGVRRARVARRPGQRTAVAALRRGTAGACSCCGAGFGAYQALYFVGVQYVGVSISTLVSLGSRRSR